MWCLFLYFFINSLSDEQAMLPEFAFCVCSVFVVLMTHVDLEHHYYKQGELSTKKKRGLLFYYVPCAYRSNVARATGNGNA